MKLKNAIAATVCTCVGVVIGCVTTITTLSKDLPNLKATHTKADEGILSKIKKIFS